MKRNVDLTSDFDFAVHKKSPKGSEYGFQAANAHRGFSTAFLLGDFIRHSNGVIITLNACQEVMEDLNEFRFEFGNQLLATGNSELRAFKFREKRLYGNSIKEFCIDCPKLKICSGEKRIPWAEYHCEEVEKYFKSKSKDRIPWPRRHTQQNARLF